MSHQHVLWVVPIKPGKTDIAREYCNALETSRREEFENSQEEIGIRREIFFLWENEGKEYIILYMDGEDMAESMRKWVDHNGDFEMWGKDYWSKFSEPSDWPEPRWAGPGTSNVPEILSLYDFDRK